MDKNKINSYKDFRKYLIKHPLTACWYGPHSSDISDLDQIINFNGIISCYDSATISTEARLTNDTGNVRKKCSIDNLAHKLILEKKLHKFIKKNRIKAILPYDTTPELEEFCKGNKLNLFSSPDKLKDILRDKTKIDNVSKLVGLSAIPGISGIIDNFYFKPLKKKFSLPLFLHFSEGAGGSGNRIVYTIDQFEKVKKEKQGEKLNVKKYFTGRSCSIDICVTKNSIICGTLEEMLIGAEPLNSNPTEYVGSSWFKNNYSIKTRRKINEIGILLGELVRSKGFIGYFHPDFIIGEDDEIFLTELNMRLGGSCGVYAKIQSTNQQVPLMAIHALSFINPSLSYDAQKINRDNLDPHDYALLILKNNFGKQIKISGLYKDGIYTYDKARIKPTGVRQFKKLRGKKNILLNGLPKNRGDTIIQEGAFICEIVTRFSISDSKSKLNDRGKKLISAVLSQITINS